ncbi:hypothetical protein S245_002494, partial [Arachis hypogaea]
MEWWMSMPKVELHAHLNGSIRGSTLLELARALWDKGLIDFSQVEHVILKNDHMTVTRIANEVVEDFASEKVVYLELRTTAKKKDSQGMSKRSYVEAVLEGIRSVSSVDVALIPYTEDPRNLLESLHAATNDKCDGNSRKKIFVRLLLSADRRETTEATMETVKLELEMRHLGVVGIDLSGNPKVGEWFLIQRRYKICSILFPIIGHACFFEEEHWRKLKSINFPDFQEENMRERVASSDRGSSWHQTSSFNVAEKRRRKGKKRNEAATTVMEVTDAVGSIELHLPQNAVAAVPLPVDAANEGWNNFSNKAQGILDCGLIEEGRDNRRCIHPNFVLLLKMILLELFTVQFVPLIFGGDVLDANYSLFYKGFMYNVSVYQYKKKVFTCWENVEKWGKNLSELHYEGTKSMREMSIINLHVMTEDKIRSAMFRGLYMMPRLGSDCFCLTLSLKRFLLNLTVFYEIINQCSKAARFTMWISEVNPSLTEEALQELTNKITNLGIKQEDLKLKVKCRDGLCKHECYCWKQENLSDKLGIMQKSKRGQYLLELVRN